VLYTYLSKIISVSGYVRYTHSKF